MAVLTQERHVELVPAASDTVPGSYQSFVITNRMVSAVMSHELPHLNVFVMTIVDRLDPFRDTLVRIANIADLTTLTIGRGPALDEADAANETDVIYLADSSVNRYDTLETGAAAAKAFRDRINALITEWITFQTSFNAPDPTPAYYTFPVVDPSQKQALITTYAAAKQAGYAQLQTKTEADAALVRAQADYTYKTSLVSGLDAIVNSATIVTSTFTSTVTQFGTLLTASNAFAGANPAGNSVGLFTAAISAATPQQAAMPSYLVTANTLLTSATLYQTARLADVTTATGALNTATANQITQAQTLTAANVLTAAALAAVYVICPDFDPASIANVPG
jgi:hypothetical protein